MTRSVCWVMGNEDEPGLGQDITELQNTSEMLIMGFNSIQKAEQPRISFQGCERMRVPTPTSSGTWLLVIQSRVYFQDRSEEHTSELQSRETISYAVFCLKKKKEKTPPHNM